MDLLEGEGSGVVTTTSNIAPNSSSKSDNDNTQHPDSPKNDVGRRVALLKKRLRREKLNVLVSAVFPASGGVE